MKMKMNRRSGLLGVLVAVLTLISAANAVGAGKPPPPAPYGAGVTPAVYLINFLLLYISNPNEAANMPAYRTPIPTDLSGCLEDNPLDPGACPYVDYALSFDAIANQGNKCSLPSACRTDPKWEKLAPGVAKNLAQINEPLGLDRANSIAQSLHIDKSMILTDQEYECTIGSPPRTEDEAIIFACINNLTNSNGNTNIPLSSYGLALNDAGDAQSLCAPNAPCLVFNDLFAGPLERIAAECGWEEKLDRMVSETPFTQLIADGHQCQELSGASDDGACIVEPVCP